jgi:hypothetical protein
MEPESSLPYSQVPATCPYPEPTPSSPSVYLHPENTVSSLPPKCWYISKKLHSITSQTSVFFSEDKVVLKKEVIRMMNSSRHEISGLSRETALCLKHLICKEKFYS